MNRSYIAAGLSLVAATLAITRSSRADNPVVPQEVLSSAQPANPEQRLEQASVEFRPDAVIEYKPIEATMEKRSIHLRYIQPDLMAWWLDPARAPLPSMLTPSTLADAGRNSATDFRPALANLPPGIARLEGYMRQSRLIAYGTPHALDELKAIIETIDKPLRQAEFTIQFVQVPDEEARLLKLWPIDERVSSKGLAFGLTPIGSRERIQKLLQAKRVGLLSTPRITAISGLKAIMVSGISLPILLDGFPPKGKPASETKNPRIAYIEVQTAVTLHPIIQADNSTRVSFDVTFHGFNIKVAPFEMRESDTAAFQFPGNERGKTIVALANFRLVRRSGG